jgi:hypothetical protein
MHHGLLLAYATASVASSIVAAFSLRRLGRAILWNLHLKATGVDVVARRQLALEVARLDLKADSPPSVAPDPPHPLTSLPPVFPDEDEGAA